MWFFGWRNYPKFGCDLEFFSHWNFISEEELVQNDWDGYFWITEKVGSNSLSVLLEVLRLIRMFRVLARLDKVVWSG